MKAWINRALLAFGFALLAWMISRFPLADIADACLRLGGWVFVTPLLCLCWFGSSSTALYFLLEGAVPWRALMWNRLVGEGYNALIPVGGVGGEPFKLRQLALYVSTERGVVALINDRLLENAVAFGFSAIAVGLGTIYFDVTPALRTTMLTYAVGGGGASIALFLITFTNVTARIGGRIARWIGSATAGHARLPVRVLLRALGCTLLARAFGLCEIAVLFHLLDLPVSIGTVVFTGGAVAAAGFVGFAIPQGMGITEAATVGIFELLHFPGPAGVAFALARRGRMLVMSVLGVVLHLTLGARVRAYEARTARGTPDLAPRAVPIPSSTPSTGSDPTDPQRA